MFSVLQTAGRRDPTRTMALRAAFVREATRRLRTLARDMRTSIVDNDVFGIVPRDDFASRILPRVLEALPARLYEFVRVPEKVAGFMRWLETQQKAGILEVIVRPDFRAGAAIIEEAWSNTYIETAYQKGITDARRKLKAAGAEITIDQTTRGAIMTAFNQPFHTDRVGLIYSRAFDRLKTMTAVMDADIRERLTEGLTNGLARGIAEGKNPRLIGKELYQALNDRIEHVGMHRATLIARAEVIRAHHVANVAEFRQAGIEGVRVEAEWLTAGYNVCPRCRAKEEQSQRKPFTLDEIEPLIPLHPQCRCTILPVLE